MDAGCPGLDQLVVTLAFLASGVLFSLWRTRNAQVVEQSIIAVNAEVSVVTRSSDDLRRLVTAHAGFAVPPEQASLLPLAARGG